MSIHWHGVLLRNTPQFQGAKMNPLTVDDILQRVRRGSTATEWEKRNVAFERECFDQAKAELDSRATSGIDFAKRVLFRAQEIKAERRARGEGQ